MDNEGPMVWLSPFGPFIWIFETGSGLELETLAKNDLELLALLPLLLNGGITGVH